MSKVKLRWEQPPAGRRIGGPERIKQEVKELKRRPGHWAKLRDKAASGNYITYRKRGVVTRVAHVGDNHYDIWGCWFGSLEEPVEVEAERLEAGVLIELPKVGTKVTVTRVEPAKDEGKIIVSVVEGNRPRKFTTTKDRSITSFGLAP